MSTKIKELEQEYKDIEDSLVDPPGDIVSNISEVNCVVCGTRLTTAEWKEFEDICEDCMHSDTAGLIDDGDYAELNFDDETLK